MNMPKVQNVSADWQAALERLLVEINQPLQSSQTGWVIAGSVATAIQGCTLIPGDIDILTQTASGVFRVADLLAKYAPDHCPFAPGTEGWHSSHAMPVTDPSLGLSEYKWHFGRWYVEGFKVEVAHISPPVVAKTEKPTYTSEERRGEGIWENGPEIWQYVKWVAFAGYTVPVIPLEIQLETNLKRGYKARITEIIRVFSEQGYERALVRRSLSKDHLDEFEQLMASF